MLFIAVGVTSLVSLVLLCRHPRVWVPGVGALVTGVVILLYLPVRTALHRPTSIDAQGDAIGIVAEFVLALAVVGPLHLGSFVILIGSLVDAGERSRDRKESAR